LLILKTPNPTGLKDYDSKLVGCTGISLPKIQNTITANLLGLKRLNNKSVIYRGRSSKNILDATAQQCAKIVRGLRKQLLAHASVFGRLVPERFATCDFG
jgi:hypothetical protein